MTARDRAGRSPQVNISLRESDAAVLAAVAFLQGASQTEVARRVVEAYLDEQAEADDVQAALKLRAQRGSLKRPRD